MSLFTQHTAATAPAESAKVLSRVASRYGFVPNLAAFVAEAPLVLDTILDLSARFERTSFDAAEQQIVLLTASVANGCEYCKTAHTALARQAGVDSATVEALLARSPLPDATHAALRDFVDALVTRRGELDDLAIAAFLEAGYSKAQVFEAVLGVALKTLTNYANHLVGAEPNAQFVAMARGQQAA